MHVHSKLNYVIAIYMYIERSVTISITRVKRYAFVMLMISLHKLTFRFMVTMVAEFCSSFIIHYRERE